VSEWITQALLDWLLEEDNPSARYLALRHLLGRPEDAPEVAAAREAIVSFAPVRALLDAQYPAGYWIKAGRGYSPRFKATVWQLLFLADLGAPRLPSIARACEHVLAHTVHAGTGLFCAHAHSSGVWPCLNGDLLRALSHFRYGDHPVVCAVVDALARRVVEDGFTCVRNGTRLRDKRTWQPCAWGCVKVLRGFAALPQGRRSPVVRQAVERGVAFLLSHDLASDQRPALVDEPSHWLRLGFPLGYGSDLLEALLALAEVGKLGEAAVGEAVRLLLQKRDENGRWPLERALPNTWADFGREGQPNKWVTLRALRVLR
jgi:hypothetical protein